MIVFIHVLIAISSIAGATLGYARPSNTNQKASYALIVATFVSGFILVIGEPTQMLRTCLSGIAYLTVVSAVVALTRRKVAISQPVQAEQI